MAPRGISVHGFDLWKILQCRAVDLAGAGGIVNRECEAVGQAAKRVLVGYSMGGRLALHSLLADKGRMWDAAVIISAHPGLEINTERAARREVDASWSARALHGDWREFSRDWQAQPVLQSVRQTDAALPDRMGLVTRRNEVARSFVCWSLGAQMPLWPRLAEIRCPLLWVAGEVDGKFSELAKRAVAALPDARLWIAPGSGHRVPWEAGEAFAARLAGFIHMWD